MPRTLLVLAVLASVTLAGCAGVQNPGTPIAPPTDGTPETDVSPGEIPGVSNGSLTNATALATANGAAIVEEGATVSVTRTGPDQEATMLLTVTADGTAELSRTASADGNESTVAYYRNDTATYVRAQSGGETRYRVVARTFRPLEGVNSSLETALALGDFTVATGSSDGATVVLTADEFDGSADSRVLGDATPRHARLVLTRDGGVQNLTVTGQRDGRSVSYTYERRETGVDSAPAPDWLADVPPTADLHADLNTDVVNDSYLRIDHDGGDTVPRNTTLSFTANGTAGTAAFDAPLEAGDTRYAYFASDGSLVVTDDRPAADVTDPVESPASVTISTADGVTLLSVGMSWGSESVREGSAGSSSGSSGGSNDP